MLRAAGYGLFLLAAATSVSPALAQDDGPLLQNSAGECPEPLAFTHVLTGDPLPHYKPDEEITPAVAEFHCSGENPYSGNAEAIADGQNLFRLCASCHGLRGEGRIGPRLTDETIKHERVATVHGEFEVVYGGAAGAMQPMGRRFTQDEILRIMAYVDTLGRQ
jgi:cytochrome c-L